MELNFCRRCGSKLKQTEPTAYQCDQSHSIYSNPLPTVGIFIIDTDGKVLMSKRAIEPRIGEADTIGGFVDGDESLEEAARREIKEEAGLSPEQYTELEYLCSAVGEYPYGGESLQVLTAFFVTKLLSPETTCTPMDDVAEIKPYDIDVLNDLVITADDVSAGISKLLDKQNVYGLTT